jgi:hypothetical protein
MSVLHRSINQKLYFVYQMSFRISFLLIKGDPRYCGSAEVKDTMICGIGQYNLFKSYKLSWACTVDGASQLGAGTSQTLNTGKLF